MQHNYVEDFGGCPSGVCYHASAVNIEANGVAAGPQQFSYNVVLSGSNNVTSGTASVSGFMMSSPSNVMAMQVDHNTLVSNSNGGLPTVGRMIETLPQGDNLGTMADFAPSFNYIDPSGSYSCIYQHLSAAINFTTQTMVVHANPVGNIDMLNASNANIDNCYGHR